MNFKCEVHQAIWEGDNECPLCVEEERNKLKEALIKIKWFRKDSNLITTWEDAYNKLEKIAIEALEFKL